MSDEQGRRPIMTSGDTLVVDGTPTTADPRESLILLYRDLRTSASGLSGREAQRRLLVYAKRANWAGYQWNCAPTER